MPQVSLKQQICTRVRVVPHLSSGIVERAKRERAWKSPHARKGDMRRGERKMRDYRQSPSYWPFTANQSFALWEQRISSKAWVLSDESIHKVRKICIGTSMICSDIWHKYLEWLNCCTQFHEPLGESNLRQFGNITSGILPNITYKSCYYLFILLPAKSLSVCNFHM